MRIIVFLNSLYTGGAELSTLTFYGWLQKRGHTVKVVFFKKASPSYDPMQFGFEAVHYLVGSNFFERLRSLNSVIKQFNPELVHSVLFEANLLTRFIRLQNGNFIHLESLVNEMYSSFRLSDPNVTRLKLEGYRLLDAVTQRWGVDHFHANGVSVANHYQDKLGISAHRVTIIPRGREANAYRGDATNRERVRQELATGNRVLFINVARQEFQKAQDVLLEALKKCGIAKEKIQLVIVGREGNMTSEIRRKIERDELSEHVVLLGHRNDIPSLMAAADVFVFPSRFEGLPGALIEAEAAGLPLICSDIPNNREVAKEGVNALFFPVDDSDQLATTIQRLINNERDRKVMGDASLHIFKEHFVLEEVHQRMEALVKGLILKRAESLK